MGLLDLQTDALEEWIFDVQSKYGVTRRLAIDYLNVAKHQAKLLLIEEAREALRVSNEAKKLSQEQHDNGMPEMQKSEETL